MSTTKTGVFNVVLSHCCQSWVFPTVDERSALTNAFLNAGNYGELITEACIFGTVFRRDQRYIYKKKNLCDCICYNSVRFISEFKRKQLLRTGFVFYCANFVALSSFICED